MSDYLSSYRLRNQEKIKSDHLDQRHIELSALFELSQSINSSLDLRSILDNLLYVPMGRMLIGKGLILLKQKDNFFRVSTVKGISPDLIGTTIEWQDHPLESVYFSDFPAIPELFITGKLRLFIPIKSNQNIKGYMVFGAKLVGKPYEDDEIEFLSSLGNIAAPAIENARVVNELSTVNLQLDRKVQELNTLFEIGKELNRVFDTQEILKRLSFSLMGQMLINQFFVALLDDKKLKIVYKKGTHFNEKNLQYCLDNIDDLKDISSPVIVNNNRDGIFEKFASCGVAAVVPMTIQGEISGYIFLGSKMNKAEFLTSEMEFLATLANIAMISLENARLFEETLEKKRLEEELNLAKTIQARLLPSEMPHINNYEIHGFNIPSKQVGGDYFDIIKLNDDEYICTIADVSGKGMPAAILMSNLQAGLRILQDNHHDLANTTVRLNNLIYQNTNIEKYITFFIAKLNIKENKLTYVNAGHNPPYLFHPDKTHIVLEKGGIILGMMPDMPFETGEADLQPGSFVIMFTDGVTEAMGPDEEPFEEYRLLDFMSTNAPINSCELFNKSLIQKLYDFAGDPTKDDDITVLSILRKS